MSALHFSLQDDEYASLYSQQCESDPLKRFSVFPVVDDVMFALAAMDNTIDRIHSYLGNDSVDDTNSVNCLHPQIEESRYICKSLYFSLVDGSSISSQFGFNKVCARIYDLFEAVRGAALSLYFDETSAEVFITAPRLVFESLFFLLTFDAACGVSGGICNAECVNVGNTWMVHIHTTELHSANSESAIRVTDSQQQTHQRRQEEKWEREREDDWEDANAVGLHPLESSSWSRPLSKAASTSHQLHCPPDGSRDMDNFNGLASKFPSALSPSSPPLCKTPARVSPMERVANVIAVKNLGCEIDFDDAVVHRGLRTKHRRFQISKEDAPAPNVVQGLKIW